jgi:4-amino-4-deoxy-L-arabinose transferase-like glycosyltransferase
MKLNRDKQIIIGLLLFSFLLRLLFKNAGLFHFDSYADVRTVEQILETGKMQYSYAYGSPTTMALVFLTFILDKFIFGATNPENAYFFVTFLTAALSTAILYMIVKKITKNNFISISSALIFTLTPTLMAVTTYPKTHAISIFFALLGGYLLISATEKNQIKNIILAGLCFGAGIGTRPFAALYIIPFALLYLKPKIKNNSISIKKEKLSWKKIIIFCVSIAIVPILLFMPWIMEKGIEDFLAKTNPEVETRGGWLGLFSENTWPSFNMILGSFTWFGMALAGLGSIYLWKKNQKILLFILLLWFALFFFSLGNLARVHARFLIPTFIPLSILTALGARMIHRKNKWAGIGAIVILLVIMFSIAYPVISYRHEHSGTRDFAIYVQENTEPDAIIMTNDLGFFVKWYGNREIVFHPRTGNELEIQEFIQSLDNYTNHGISIYSTAEGFGIDPEGKVQQAIQEKYSIDLIGESENEWYGGSSLELKTYNEKLFKLTKKNQ